MRPRPQRSTATPKRPSRAAPASLPFAYCGEQFILSPFQLPEASRLLEWVPTPEDLHWLSPNTAWPLTSRKVREWQGRGCEAFSLANSERAMIGYGEANFFSPRGSDAWLGHLIIDPRVRSRGLGQLLVQSLLWHAFHRRGATRISLIVFPENAAAVNCYVRGGFRVVGSERHRCASGEMGTLTRLELRASEFSSPLVVIADDIGRS